MIQTQDKVLDAIAAALRAREHAKSVSKPEDNPLHGHDLAQLTRGAGILKGADLHPAKNVAEQGALGFDMEVARNEALADRKEDRSLKRKARARQAAQRKAQFDAIVRDEKPVDPERMQQAWLV